MFINDEAQKQVLPILAKATVAPTTEVQQRASSLLQLNPGQQVKAEIIANLPNNLYLARIAGDLYKIEIPLNVQPGETMEMTFVSADPRITFQLYRPEGGETVQFSSMGKWLSGVIKDTPPPANLQQTLLDSPAQGSTLLAARLRAAMTQNGLFYESHLAQWAAGELQLEEILKEPQGKLSRAVSGDASDGTKEQLSAGYADSRTLPLIKEQLLLLNSGVLSWKGEAWPGQGMELAVTARDGGDEEAGVEATLSLDLAHLGGVGAKLHFGPEGFFVDFVCERPGVSDLLRKGGDELRAALVSSGLHLTRMAVKDEETVQ
jgi:flagellar hook-length control protein FliK